MPDIGGCARHSIIAAAARGDAGQVAVLDPAARFSLRLGSAEAAARQSVAACRIDLPINSCVVNGERLAARLGPDEWLLTAPESDGVGLGRQIAAELAGSFFSLVDIGHRNVGFRVGGAHARDILNGGCPLDLDDARFPAGSATRTVFGKAEIVLIRAGAAPSYQVECWRSFAPYVHGLLQEVAREFDAIAPARPR
ncbi:MAG TPA: sarcosine oxidase subunit gamma family protein [Rhodopseudomonas sp.]|uniref:sarcosine oxidase subunit gamma n=1 Tax=Rhodopseudomonas sp. TaxID=1078 RepID=UPI002ED9E011